MKTQTLQKTFPILKENRQILAEVQNNLAFLSDADFFLKKDFWDLKISRLIRKITKQKDDLFWFKQIAVVKSWTVKQNLKLSITNSGDNSYNYENNNNSKHNEIIKINSNLSAETQLYYTLHECGHYLVMKSKMYNEKYPYNDFDILYSKIKINREKIKHSKDILTKILLEQLKKKLGEQYDVDFLSENKEANLMLQTKHACALAIQEEFEAWEKGEGLAKQLKLKINKKKFLKLKLKSLFTYFEWAVFSRDPI